MAKHQLKRLLGVLILLGAVAALAGAVYLAGQVVVYSGTGANFADALNVAPALPDGLAKRVRWLPDALADPASRPLEPVVRQQITDAYLRAWGQLDLSYQQGRPFGLATYFGGPLLVQVSEAVSATVAGPYAVRQASLGHELELTFYSDDGSAVGFTDHAARFVQQFTGRDPADTHFVETAGVYDVAMVLEQGRWRVRAWVNGLPAATDTVNGLPAATDTVNGLPAATDSTDTTDTVNGLPAGTDTTDGTDGTNGTDTTDGTERTDGGNGIPPYNGGTTARSAGTPVGDQTSGEDAPSGSARPVPGVTSAIAVQSAPPTSGEDAPSGSARPVPDGDLVRVHGDRLTLDGQPWSMRGVNYYPSATPWTLFWPNYDPATTAQDLARVAELGFNTARIFVPYTDFGGDTPDPTMLARLADLLDQAQAHELKVIVTLFDHRTDHSIDAWGADDLHLAGIVGPLAQHPAILAWDLKNEPDRDAKANTPARNLAWLRHVAATVRRLDPNHLITVGWSTPQAAAAAPTDFVDFVSYHYYTDPAALPAQRQALADAVAAAGPAKPIVLGEFGKSTWQWFLPQQYLEDRQAEYLAAVRTAEAAGPGSAGDVVWTLYDFETVPLAEFRFPWQKATQAHMGVLRADGTEKSKEFRQD